MNFETLESMIAKSFMKILNSELKRNAGGRRPAREARAHPMLTGRLTVHTIYAFFKLYDAQGRAFYVLNVELRIDSLTMFDEAW